MLVAAGVIFYAAGRPLEDPYVYRSIADGSGRAAARSDPASANGQPNHIVEERVLPDGTVIQKREPVHSPADTPGLMGLGMPAGPVTGQSFKPAVEPPANAVAMYHTTSPEDPPLIHTTVWSIPDASLDPMASYFQHKAIAQGYEVVNRFNDTDRSVIRTIYSQANRWLTVRCRQVGSEVRVVVELRYTIHDQQ